MEGRLEFELALGVVGSHMTRPFWLFRVFRCGVPYDEGLWSWSRLFSCFCPKGDEYRVGVNCDCIFVFCCGDPICLDGEERMVG